MKRHSFIVTKDFGPRPAGPPNECFYCHARIGEEHKKATGDVAGCVLRERSVVVRFQVEVVMTMPEDWDAHMIEFNLNESSRCVDNTLAIIDKQNRLSEPDETRGCLCGKGSHVFVREATDEETINAGIQLTEPS